MSARWLASQNSKDAQLAFAAGDVLWSDVQTIRATEVFLAVLVPILASIAALYFRTAQAQLGAAYLGFTMAIVDVLLTWFASNKRRDAAQMQDRFDSIALHLPRTPMRADDDPDISVLTALAKRQKPSRATRNRDWYTPLLGDLPLELGRIACMRESTSWDSSLRRFWAIGLFVLLGIATLSVATWSILTAEKADLVFLSVIAPLSPAFIWTLREALDQLGAANAYDNVRAKVRSVWNGAIAGALDAVLLTDSASDIACALLTYRSAASPVPHWLYRLRRAASAANAHDTAEALLRAYRADHSG